ncbi:unnamed protein product [Knipowitschia caucasica]
MASLLPWVVLMFAVMLSAAQGQWPVQRVCFCSQNLIQRHKSLGAIPLEAKCFEENPPNCSIHAFKIQGLKNTNKKLCFKPEASQIRTFTKAGGVCRPSVTSV